MTDDRQAIRMSYRRASTRYDRAGEKNTCTMHTCIPSHSCVRTRMLYFRFLKKWGWIISICCSAVEGMRFNICRWDISSYCMPNIHEIFEFCMYWLNGYRMCECCACPAWECDTDHSIAKTIEIILAYRVGKKNAWFCLIIHIRIEIGSRWFNLKINHYRYIIYIYCWHKPIFPIFDFPFFCGTLILIHAECSRNH